MVANLGNPNLESVEIDTVWNEWQDFWLGTPVETTTQGNIRRGNQGGWTVNFADTVTTSKSSRFSNKIRY
jgi:hypothetical protein